MALNQVSKQASKRLLHMVEPFHTTESFHAIEQFL